MGNHQAGHQPRLLRLNDGRYAVGCQQCEVGKGTSVPVGIGLPISSQIEAESICRNHGAGRLSTAVFYVLIFIILTMVHVLGGIAAAQRRRLDGDEEW
jgi:hypothetical protein